MARSMSSVRRRRCGGAGAEALVAPLNAMLAALDPAETAGVLLTFDTHASESYASSAEAEQF